MNDDMTPPAKDTATLSGHERMVLLRVSVSHGWRSRDRLQEYRPYHEILRTETFRAFPRRVLACDCSGENPVR